MAARLHTWCTPSSTCPAILRESSEGEEANGQPDEGLPLALGKPRKFGLVLAAELVSAFAAALAHPADHPRFASSLISSLNEMADDADGTPPLLRKLGGTNPYVAYLNDLGSKIPPNIILRSTRITS